MDFAERLSLWFDPLDAIGLQAAHQEVRGIATAAARPQRGARSGPPTTLAQDLQQLRAVLAHAIGQDPRVHAGGKPGEGGDAGYAPWHQRHLQLQRQMEQAIAALRDHARQGIGAVSPALRQLATLDACLEGVLARREQALLPRLPLLLKRRFDQLLAEDGGLETFRKHWHEALLAELDLRLAPVAGLLDALADEMKNGR